MRNCNSSYTTKSAIDRIIGYDWQWQIISVSLKKRMTGSACFIKMTASLQVASWNNGRTSQIYERKCSFEITIRLKYIAYTQNMLSK